MIERKNKISKETGYRIEHDFIGEKQIPKDVHYGVQILHAAENFFITGLEMCPEFINSFTRVKKAAAITNSGVGRLDKKRADTIVQAYNGIMSGKLHDEFIIDPIQGGTGTSLSMDTNEVIANRAIEILEGEKDDYSVVDPDGHVSYGQSTSDVFPSRGKLTTLELLYRAQARLERLYHVLMEKSEELNYVIKVGRTQLQDTVPVRLRQEFHAYATTICRDINHFDRTKEGIRHLNLGGATIGTGLNADVGYLQRAVKNISLIPDLELIQVCDSVGATQNLNGYIVCSRAVKSCAVDLSKMCNDLRPMLSGPRTRLEEINLSAKQNGSSVMPGRANPVIPEVVNQVAFHVIGNGMIVTMAAETGQLELNVSKPIIFYKLFQSVEIIACAMHTLVGNCISGITTNEQHCKDIVENSARIITAICLYVGYEEAANVAKEVIRTGKSIRELTIRDELLTKKQLDITPSLISMTEPGISGIKVMNRMGGL